MPSNRSCASQMCNSAAPGSFCLQLHAPRGADSFLRPPVALSSRNRSALHHSLVPRLQAGGWREPKPCSVDPARISLQGLFPSCHHFPHLEGCTVISAATTAGSSPCFTRCPSLEDSISPPRHSWPSPCSCHKPGGTTGWQSQRYQVWALLSPCSEMEHPQPGSVAPRRDKDRTGVLNCLSAGCEASKRESMINSPRQSEAQSAG